MSIISRHINVLLLSMLAMLATLNTYAAFPASANTKEVTESVALKKSFPATSTDEEASSLNKDEAGYGIASAVCGIVALPMTAIGLAVYALGGAIAVFVMGGVLAIAAIALGAAGFKRRLNGLAIAGFVLGIISSLYFIPVMIAEAGNL